MTFSQVSNLNGDGADDFLLGSSYEALAFAGRLYFVANDASGTPRLLRTDGLTIEQVSEQTAGGGTMWVYREELLFAAGDATGKSKLFRYRGGEISQVSNTAGDSAADFVWVSALIYGDRFYFVALNESATAKLYAYDGDGVSQVASTTDREDLSDAPILLTTADGQLLFGAHNPDGGWKLFSLCDAAAGCAL